ncbi:MAG: hypothetical protein M0R48_01245 [Candidatus Omnitrophica bacterium]|nr:hypothetical protein [Candidatus Omnitrophota bacterium]
MIEQRRIVFPVKGNDAKCLVPFVQSLVQKIYTLISQEYLNKYKIQLKGDNDPKIVASDIFIQFDKKISIRINFFAREKDINTFIAGVVIEKSLLGFFSRVATDDAQRFSEIIYNKIVNIIEAETGLRGWTHEEAGQRLKNLNPTA